MEIGAIIKKRRVAMKLTQEELAEKLNVTPQAVSRWENEISLPDIALVPRIAEVLRNIVKDILNSNGYEVLQAKDGEECMDILENEPIDLLLLDINMPGNGLEILKEVKHTYPQLPVLVLSAMADDKTVKKTLELGAAGFVAKPFGVETLLEHLKYA